MTLQIAVSSRNARLTAFITDIGASPVFKLFTGAQPADCATADSGTGLMSITLSATFASTPSDGSSDFTDFPMSHAASASGIAGYFRLYMADGTTCMMQGDVSMVGDSGNITINETNMLSGNNYDISTFTLGDQNA